MSQLPQRPDIDQLRRRARELQRATPQMTLAAAQLAIARDHGFASWPKLKSEVDRRRASGLLPAGATELVDSQYGDRPHLRPVLDAILAALPEIGDVSVRARKTCVSLVGPNRMFAAVQATTKSRVDLGLRLDGQAPHGRLLTARDIANGAINVRMALSSPGDVDAEVLDMLRRAYAGSVRPPARKPARRAAAAQGAAHVVVEASDLPGRRCNPDPSGHVNENVHVGLLCPREVAQGMTVVPHIPGSIVGAVHGDAKSARWELDVTVRRDDRGFDVTGPCVRGPRGDRHIGLSWGDVQQDGAWRIFRGAKLPFRAIDDATLEAATRPGVQLVARLGLTDARGNPRCATVPASALSWTVEPRGDVEPS